MGGSCNVSETYAVFYNQIVVVDLDNHATFMMFTQAIKRQQ